METHRDVIDAAPSQRALAKVLGLSEQAVHNMRARDSIHARHWVDLSEYMASIGRPVTLRQLADMADRRAG